MRYKHYILFILSILLLSLTACGKKNTKQELIIEKEPYERYSFITTKVLVGDMEPVLDLKLSVTDYKRTDYIVEDEYYEIEKVNVQVGDKVKKGDILVSFKQDDYKKQINEYKEQKETNKLLIDHYNKLMKVNSENDYKNEIKLLNEDIKLCDLRIQELQELIKKYSIIAKESGTITYINDIVNTGYIYPNAVVLTEASGAGSYYVTTEDMYEFKVGDEYEAEAGIVKYTLRVSEVEITNDLDVDKQIVTFEPVSDMSYVSADDRLEMHIEKPKLKNVVYVDKKAIISGVDANYVYVIDEAGYRTAVKVETGDIVDNYMIILNGLSGGEEVTVE